MVIDTSAAIAILRAEEEAEDFLSLIADAPIKPRISAVSLVEAGLALSDSEFDLLIHRLIPQLEITMAEFDRATAFLAVQASREYGKGRSNSKARLNFGDCCSYATAKTLGLPLLFKGDDFVHTDIEPALKSKRQPKRA